MNEALLWLFLFQPVVDNLVLIEFKEKEKTCAHSIVSAMHMQEKQKN